MKAKTRLKVAARGMGPLVRPGRPGRGRRGALAPEPGTGASDAAAGTVAGEVQPVIWDGGPLGEFLEPPAGSVRERVRLRPAVREALDVEAGRLGMTREALCRFVLEEVARKAVEGVQPGVVDAAGAPPIPAGYVGAADGEEADALAAGADPEVAGGGGSAEPAGGPVPGPGPPSGRALLRAGRRSARDMPRLGTLRRVRRLGRFGWRARVHGAWAAVLAFGLLATAAAVSWRYEVAGTAGEGVYVVDRWRGAVWRCGAAVGGRPPACAQAVFRQQVVRGEVARLGRVVR